jgi:hypothetical protein
MAEFIGEILAYFICIIPGAIIRTLFLVIKSGLKLPLIATFKKIVKGDAEDNSAVGFLAMGCIVIVLVIIHSFK